MRKKVGRYKLKHDGTSVQINGARIERNEFMSWEQNIKIDDPIPHSVRKRGNGSLFFL